MQTMHSADAAFWDAEYASGALGERAFDWLFDFAELGEARWRALLGPAGGRVAVVGCQRGVLAEAQLRRRADDEVGGRLCRRRGQPLG